VVLTFHYVALGWVWFALPTPDLALGVVCVDGGAGDLKAYFGPTWQMAEQTMKPPALTGITGQTLRAWMDSSPLADGSDPQTAAGILLGNFEDDGTGHLRPRLELANHMQIARHLFELDGYELMARVRCPVLFIPAGHPDHEDTPKVHAMERAQSVLGARAKVVWVEGIHDIPVQRPDEVGAAIADFLSYREEARGTPLSVMPTWANTQPAFGCYTPDAQTGIASPAGLFVLTLDVRRGVQA